MLILDTYEPIKIKAPTVSFDFKKIYYPKGGNKQWQ